MAKKRKGQATKVIKMEGMRKRVSLMEAAGAIVGLDVEKAHVSVNETVAKAAGAAATVATDKDVTSWATGTGLITPPVDPNVLVRMPEETQELGQCIDAMVTNTALFGYKLRPTVDVSKMDEKQRAAVEDEALRLKNWFRACNFSQTEGFNHLRSRKRWDKEVIGAGYLECVRPNGELTFLSYTPAFQIRRTARKFEHEAMVKIPQLSATGEIYIIKRKITRKFRKFCQVISGMEKVWFREYGDPSPMNRENGEYFSREDLKAPTGASKEEKKQVAENNDKLANELISFETIGFPHYDYPLPRWINELFALYGNRAADEINYITLRCNNIPSMAVAVSNGQLTQDSVDRLKEFAQEVIQNSGNFSKFVILEAEPFDEGINDSTNTKIDIKPLTKDQIQDAMFQNYQENNSDRIRRRFRLPGLYVGRTKDYNRATSDNSKKIAEEQVFAPERALDDEVINRTIMVDLKARYHVFVGLGTNVTNDQDLLDIMKVAEKTGALTPALSRAMIEDILGEELTRFPLDGIEENRPFSAQMAELVKNLAQPNEPSQQVAAEKRLKKYLESGDILEEQPDAGEMLDAMRKLSDVAMVKREVRKALLQDDDEPEA
jgi:PBSX family phage portal protein